MGLLEHILINTYDSAHNIIDQVVFDSSINGMSEGTSPDSICLLEEELRSAILKFSIAKSELVKLDESN